ncbi:hypothetical protein VTL71DRAFT_9592 [Oculimacula yallundae]|uniref:SGNH hydrolase-type esterase domain-containing protein n=1 Tax=Oculimacula yallundae TaxID=86028 RepID=A0ABR4BS41_9HELO
MASPPPPDPPMTKPLSILSFGASLVEGYSRYGMLMTPFSATTKRVLDERLGKEFEVQVATSGVSGQLVTRGFRERMGELYSSPSSDSSPYDWVVFLGGTNDIAYCVAPSKIYAEIRAITAVPLDSGARVLLLTIPECAYKDEANDSRRDELNALIKGDGREGVYTLDLHALVPYHAMPEDEREEIWDDGLHFTPKGYERVGSLVAERIVEIMRES